MSDLIEASLANNNAPTLDPHPDCERLSNAELREELALADARLENTHRLGPEADPLLEPWLIQRRRLILAELERRNGNSRSTIHRFSLIQAKDLLASEEPETEWVWERILPAGGLSLLAAKPKVGKTTLAFNLAVAVASGRDFLGRETKQSPVIYLALEEKRSEIRKKLKALGEAPELICFHFGSAPEKAIQEVKTLIQETKAGLLVVDVLQKLCRVKDLTGCGKMQFSANNQLI